MYLSDKFISAGEEYFEIGKSVSAPYLIRKFNFDSAQSAEITITGLGFYKLFINGVDITRGILSPFITNSNEMVYYDNYNVLPYLVEGENIIGVMLGNGMQNCVGGFVWEYEKTPFRSAPKLALAFELDGELQFEADETFLTHPSPILEDDLRIGELYDANCEIAGWNLPGFEPVGWENACVTKSVAGEKRICEAAPIKVRKELKPVEIWKVGDGYVYDFGENSAGAVRLEINGTKNQRITMLFSDKLFEDRDLNWKGETFGGDFPDYYTGERKARQEDTYICSGNGVEVYEPSFTYHGFRYAKVIGVTKEQATESLLVYMVFNTELKKRGNFFCSDEMLNAIYEIAQNSAVSNFHHIQTDCPHREKNGWTADIALSAEQTLLNYNAEKNYSEWLRNVCKAQNEKGVIPGIVPTWGYSYDWGNGPAWDCVITELPYMVYRYTGDTKIIKDTAPTIMKYLRYLETRKNSNGLLEIGLGDWSHPSGTSVAPLVLTDSVTTVDIASKAAMLMEVIGESANADYCRNFAANMKKTVRENLITDDKFTFLGNCQTSQAMGIYYDILEEDEKAKAFETLVEIIHRDNDYIGTGVLGLRVIFHVLSEFGRQDLAYKMITNKEIPSYAYLVLTDNSTMDENMGNPGAGSKNHHFMSDVAAWFMKALCGINYNPKITGEKVVVISPKFLDNVTEASAEYNAPEGRIFVSYKQVGDKTEFSLEVPKNLKTKIILQKDRCDLLGRSEFAAASGKYIIKKK